MEMLNETQKKYLNELEQIAGKYFEHADIDELREKDRYKVEIYFDTFYILDMIQGYWEIQTGNSKIDTDIFNDDTFLVKALAYLGYIKNIKMLLPHIAELSDQLKKTFLLPSDEITEEEVDAFLEEIKFADLKSLAAIQRNNMLEEYLEKMAPNAEKIFKANYVLSELLWVKRSNYLFNSPEPIITYDRERFDSMKLMESRLFKDILAAISTGSRKLLTINNFRDAMALCMFKEKIKQIKNDSGVLPIFYVTRDIYSRLTDDLKKEFSYARKKKKFNLLKDTEYFIVDAIFSQNTKEEDPAIAEEIVFDRLKHIKSSLKVYREIDILFPTSEIVPLINQWSNYRNHDFFQKIWEEDQKGGKHALHENIKSLLKYDLLTKNDNAFSSIIEKERKVIRRALDEQVQDFVFLEEIWGELDNIKQELDNLFNDRSKVVQNQRTDIFRDEGLTRFSPPQGWVEDNIKMIWSGFLNSHLHEDHDNHRLKVTLTKLIYEGCLKPNHQINHDKILVAISILFVFHRNDLIIRIVEKLNGNFGDRYQIALIYAASLIKNVKKADTRQKIDEIIQRFESNENFSKNYKLWIGLSFIKFNIWMTLKPSVKNGNPVVADQYINSRYLKDSIKLTKKAYDYLEEHTKKEPFLEYRFIKYYYSLNNYVYYTVESEDIKQINDPAFHRDYVIELQRCQSNDDFRQSRFSDTIARYFYAKAKIADDGFKEHFFDQALDAIKDAINTAVLKDDRFTILQNLIQVDKEEFLKRTKPAQ